ncbi:MAG TPA: hypothetical protein VMT88_09355 [Actinomycetes bacterium]|nr:hypothetical protein [Actinomycetes bacterium]
MGISRGWLAERNWRAWIAWSGVAAGLLLLLGGLLAASSRNEDVVGYAKQECAFLAKFAGNGNIDPRLDPYQQCLNDSLNQSFLNPGQLWFLFGGVLIAMSVLTYWRNRPGRGEVRA